MSNRWIVWLLVSALFAPAALAKGPVELARSGKWHVNYDDDSCRLAGGFGEGENQIIARFTRYQPGDSFDLELFGPPMRSQEAYSERRIDFGPVENPRVVRAMNGTAGATSFSNFGSQRLDDLHVLDEAALPPTLTPDYEASVTTLTVRPLRGKAYRLVLGSMRATMAELRKCSADLVRHWGFDPVEQGTLKQPAVPLSSPGTWLRSYDYPSGLLISGNNGIVHFRLDVDEKGGVAGCHIQAATRPEGFASITCNLITRRAKFSPALNQQGQAIRSYYVNTVRWMVGP